MPAKMKKRPKKKMKISPCRKKMNLKVKKTEMKMGRKEKMSSSILRTKSMKFSMIKIRLKIRFIISRKMGFQISSLNDLICSISLMDLQVLKHITNSSSNNMLLKKEKMKMV